MVHVLVLGDHSAVPRVALCVNVIARNCSLCLDDIIRNKSKSLGWLAAGVELDKYSETGGLFLL